jgi:hypothetical protein
MIRTLYENPYQPPFGKRRDFPSLAKRGRGGFPERVNTISKPYIN